MGQQVTPRSPWTLDRLLADGELDGYRRGYPPGSNRYWTDVDREVCDESKCEGCGHVGLGVAAFHRPDGGRGSHRTFAVCPACGRADEF